MTIIDCKYCKCLCALESSLSGQLGFLICIRSQYELHEITSSTLVLITHDQALTKRCDRIVHMNDGRLTEGPGIIAAGPSA